MGESSYTLIDDNGVEFYLSDRDKRRREKGEDPRETNAEESDAGAKSSTTAKKKTVSIGSVLSEDEQYQKAAAQLASRAAAAGQKEAGFSSLYYGDGKKG